MERERIDCDVLVVGAGPAGLACALRLTALSKERNASREIVVVEKGVEAGQHILSGAIMDPIGIEGLFGPTWRERGCPIEAEVSSEVVYFFTARRKFRLPVVPPPLSSHGCVVVTLSRVVQWLRDQAQVEGINVFEGFPAESAILEENAVRGVLTADRGLDRDGRPRESFAPGTELRAKVTVLAEGTRGSVTKALVDRLSLHGPNPQTYALGVKEVWQLPPGRLKPGAVMHTAGWPLSTRHYGGGWIYGLAGDRASIGFVSALDGGDPRFDPHEAMQRWKTHPWLRELLSGGKALQAGAKTVPEGGYWSQPKLFGDGFLIAGDGASFLNAPRLKGIHTALRSGTLAADATDVALARDDVSAASLALYDRLYRRDWSHAELRRFRNLRQAFEWGFFAGAARAGLMTLFGGRLLSDRVPVRADHERLHRVHAAIERASFVPDGKLTIDKLTSVFLAGSIHEENQPSHLVVADTDVCRTRCREEYGNPCESFCPAKVYEMVDDPERPGSKRLRINHSNCVHCKTCDILDPYQVITWKVPGDAGGPKYLGM